MNIGEAISMYADEAPWVPAYMQALYDLTCRGQYRHIWEIGVSEGKSTHVFLCALQNSSDGSLISCDHKHCEDVVTDSSLRTHWSFCCMSSEDFFSSVSGSVDMIYIDGDHRYVAVAEDAQQAWSKLGIGGVMVLHDTKSFPDGPGRVVSNYEALGVAVEHVDTPNGLAVLTKEHEVTVVEQETLSPASELQLANITVVIPNYKTPHLIPTVLETMLSHYPDIAVLLIDNGSEDKSTEYIRAQAIARSNVKALLYKENVYHGPVMHQAIKEIKTRFVFFLDTDCTVHRGGFLEEMLERFRDSHTYVVGRLVNVTSDHRCLFLHPYYNPGEGHTYCRTNYMLLDTSKYYDMRPFCHHGAPGTWNLREAEQIGYKLVDFPIASYIEHTEKGTRDKYGIPGWHAFEPGYEPEPILERSQVERIP